MTKNNIGIIKVLVLIMLIMVLSFTVACSKSNINSNDENSVKIEASLENVEVQENGRYISKEEVAKYLIEYEKLPSNFVKKDIARSQGWISDLGNLEDVLPGKSIGGDVFMNFEEQLPEADYIECDINYKGGYRGPQRLVFSYGGNIYYTEDHYENFEKVYES